MIVYITDQQLRPVGQLSSNGTPRIVDDELKEKIKIGESTLDLVVAYDGKASDVARVGWFVLVPGETLHKSRAFQVINIEVDYVAKELTLECADSILWWTAPDKQGENKLYPYRNYLYRTSDGRYVSHSESLLYIDAEVIMSTKSHFTWNTGAVMGYWEPEISEEPERTLIVGKEIKSLRMTEDVTSLCTAVTAKFPGGGGYVDQWYDSEFDELSTNGHSGRPAGGRYFFTQLSYNDDYSKVMLVDTESEFKWRWPNFRFPQTGEEAWKESYVKSTDAYYNIVHECKENVVTVESMKKELDARSAPAKVYEAESNEEVFLFHWYRLSVPEEHLEIRARCTATSKSRTRGTFKATFGGDDKENAFEVMAKNVK